MKFSLLMLLAVSQLAAPYPDSTVIADIEFDWSSHRRAAQGSDNFQLTWAADNNLYGAWGDGGGFNGSNSVGRVGLGVARIEGGPSHFVGHNVWGGTQPEHRASFSGKSWGMLAAGSTLYMWVVPDVPVGKTYRNHYEYIQLATSTDKGASWQLADWKFEERELLTIPTFLNAGRNYQEPPFGPYAYSYFIRPSDPTMEHQGPNGVGLVAHVPGALFLGRVPLGQITNRSRWEFFSGLDPQGSPQWASVQAKQPVLLDSNGVGWCVSAAYHVDSKRVLLCTEHSKSHSGQLGIFDATTPWGPWTTVKYYTHEKPFGHARPGSTYDWKNNVFFASFPTKWFHADRFAMTFTGSGSGKNNDSFNVVQGVFKYR